MRGAPNEEKGAEKTRKKNEKSRINTKMSDKTYSGKPI